MKKIQNALNKLDKNFKPRKTKRISYQQPQRQGNRVVFVQPK
jgi:hypothetical protein